MKLALLFVLMLFLGRLEFSRPHASQDTPKIVVGKPAPALKIGEWLDGGSPVVLGTGKACVLVFWATWCGSCIAEIPRLNELVSELANEPLTFISIAAEPRDKVSTMLEARPLKTRVALDAGGTTFDAFDAHVLPKLVLVDKNGIVAALPRLKDLTGDVLRTLAAGGRLNVPDAPSRPADVAWDDGKSKMDVVASLAHVWIERSSSASGAIHFPPDHGRITGDGIGFASLLQVACDAESYEVRSTLALYSDSDSGPVYRISVKAPDDRPDTARAMLLEQLRHLFTFRAEWVEVDDQAPVLRRIAGKDLVGLAPSKAVESTGMARNGSIHYVKVPFESIAAQLGTFGLNQKMIDETSLSGDFDIDIEWTPGKISDFKKALLACGLECATETRKVRRLLVTKP